MAPTAILSTLHRADGSATYSDAGFTILGAVNGPIEVQRRDELPEEAAIEVNIRPAVGVGGTSSTSILTHQNRRTSIYIKREAKDSTPGTRERHLETLLHSTLKDILLTHHFPRTLIQLTLQIVSVPEPAASHSRWLDPLSVRLSSSLPYCIFYARADSLWMSRTRHC